MAAATPRPASGGDAVITGVFLFLVAAVLAWAVETRLRALYGRPSRASVPFRALPPGTRWLACHDMACGHMTTRWIPTPGGGLRCEHAARQRGVVHLTHTTTQGEQ